MKTNFWFVGLISTVVVITTAGLFAFARPAASDGATLHPQVVAQQTFVIQAARTLATKDPQARAADPTARANFAGMVTGPAVAATVGGIGLVVVIALVGAAITDRRSFERRRAERTSPRPVERASERLAEDVPDERRKLRRRSSSHRVK